MNNVRGLIFGICILIFGIINLCWALYTDYKLNYWITEYYYKINLGDYWSIYKTAEKDIWVLSSLYFGKSLLILPIYFTAFFCSGYVATQIVFDLGSRKKITKILILGFIIFWIIKIPVLYAYSTIPGAEAGLFAW
ncbi:MAG: hypothetical protein ACKVQB_10950 [Bacteroidia bacterium]